MNNYNAPSVDEIQKGMLNNIPGNYDKEVGGFTHDLSKTYALESHQIHKGIEEVFSKLDINNFQGEELERQVFQKKGLERKRATFAIGELLIKGNGIVPLGSLFETEAGTQFQTVEEVTISIEGSIRVKAAIPGKDGNVPEDCITLIPITIQGITEVTNPLKTYDGFEEETDESLIERYLIEIQKPATSGNVYHYLQWARETSGVGDARVFPLWNGDNTVKIVIIDEEKQPASEELVTLTQEYIDPKGIDNSTWGAGYGEAPIGAYCTVVSAVPVVINIETVLVIEAGYSVTDIKFSIENALRDHLKEITFVENHISYSILSSKILDVPGIKEWSELRINNGTINIPIENYEVAVLGSVVVDE